jgi:hypothetical protein
MMPRIFQSLIQSDFGSSQRNFEAAIQEGAALNHWWRDDASLEWKRGQTVISANVAGAGALIQSDFRSASHGNFEGVVPLRSAGGAVELWHFWHDNSDVSLPWRMGQRVSGDPVLGPGALIQSDFRSSEHGNFEVVVPLRGASGRAELWHFWHDNGDVNAPWRRGQRVTGPVDDVAGPASLIQSDFRGGEHGNFEVVVPLRSPQGAVELWHFWHDNTDVALPWRRGQRIAVGVTGPAMFIQSDFRSVDHGNFELVVPVGHALTHYWHDNSDVNLPWRQGQVVTDAVGGWGCIIQSGFGAGAHRNFEVLVEECTQSVVGYWHPNQNVDYPWLRHQVLLGEPYPSRVLDSRKVVQLTGELDRQGWNGSGLAPFAFNRTESRFGIRGTDLGASFEHKQRVYFLFGDTWRVGQTPAEQDLDSVAYTTDPTADQGLHLTFNPRPPHVPEISQHGFEVPLDGLSRGSRMYVFFSTDHYAVDGRDLMGRSVLAFSDDDGLEFTLLYTFSKHKFINVSVETGVARRPFAESLQLPDGTEVLWIWGSGTYRSSSIYLAVLPLQQLETGTGLRYFSGSGASPAWSPSEADASPLLCAGDVGELSVRWNAVLQSYLAFFNTGNPRGIVMHSAPNPWGPWSASPVMAFDPGRLADPSNPCSGAGYGRFMHIAWNVRHCDHVQDDMFSPGSFRDNEFGGEYGPYQVTRYAHALENGDCRAYFAMSLWNPYQVALMRTTIPKGFVLE